MKTVPEMLRAAAAIYEERNKLYGDNYKIFGSVVAALFPEGLTLRTAEDWNRAGILIQIISKLSRYSRQWANGHKDSLDDMAVYTMMLQELDEEMRSGTTVEVDLRCGPQPGPRPGWPLEKKL